MVANLHKISERENMPTRHNDGSRQTTEQALVFSGVEAPPKR